MLDLDIGFLLVVLATSSQRTALPVCDCREASDLARLCVHRRNEFMIVFSRSSNPL